jgi:hypothetical protein
MDKLTYRGIAVAVALILGAAWLVNLVFDDDGSSALGGGPVLSGIFRDSAGAPGSGATGGNAAAAAAFEAAKKAQVPGTAPGTGDTGAPGDTPAGDGTPASVPAPSGPPLSASTYRSQANAICAASDRKITAVVSKSGPSVNIDGFNKFVTETFLPVTEDQLSQLERLAPPAPDSAKIQAFLDGMAKGIEQVRAEPNSLLANDPFDAASNIADDYGIADCITGPNGG